MATRPIFGKSDWDNLALVRGIVLYRLKHDTRWDHFDYQWEGSTGGPGSRFVEFQGAGARERFVALATEVMWEMIIQGVITPGLNSSNPNLPWFRITSYGQQVLEADRFIPHDPTGYLDQLRAVEGPIELDVGFAYVEEALNCFTRGCHMASVLLLGVASEAVFNGMCDIVRGSLTDGNEKPRLDPSRHVKPRHRWIVHKYEALSRDVKHQLPDSLDMTLISLYNLIREQRNELGHPQDRPPELSREQAFVFLQLFPRLVRDSQAFAEYCQDNGI